MGAKLIRNSAANLLGALLPAAASLLTMPYIVRALGEQGYGLLTLTTAIVGYFAILDVNITAGSVKYVAEYHALGRKRELNEVISFGGFIYLGIGLIGAVAIFVLADTLVSNLFRVSEPLVALSIKTVKLAAVGFVFGQLQAYLASIPQALQRYDVSAKLETAFGTLVPLASVAVLWLGQGLYEVVLLRVVTSVANVALLLYICRTLLPELHPVRASRAIVGQLAAFSAYAYLNRMAAVFYAHADKLIVGSLIGMAGLTYYTVPATLINRVLAITFKLGAVIFPAASELQARDDLVSLRRIYFYATKYIFFLNASFVLLACLFAREILSYWMGPVFAEHGAWVANLVALSMLVDSISNLPSLVNDGLGHPRVTGVFAIGRAMLGLILTFAGTRYFGIIGAAAGHLLASAIMACAFVAYVHKRTIPFSLREIVYEAYLPIVLVCLLIAGVIVLVRPAGTLGLAQALIGIVGTAVLIALFGLFLVAAPAHRYAILAWLRGLAFQPGTHAR